MSAFRAVLLLTFFFLDVHVRASEHNADKNADCWGRVVPCAIDASGFRKELRRENLTVVMSGHAVIHERSDRSIQLIAGTFLIDTKSVAKFNTPYAEFACASECKGIFERSLDRITLKSLSGQWEVKRLGEPHRYRVSGGLQVSISEVTDNGMAEMDFPQSLPWMSTVKQWATLYPGESAKFKVEVASFREVWKEAVESASEVHFEAASRNIASHEAELAAERARKKRREHEDQRLRKLFREKNYFD